MRRPGTVPLSDLRHYQIRPHQWPERAADRGDFYIVDGWLRPSLALGHGGARDACFLVEFVDGDDDRLAYFVLEWSPLREKVIELVLRGGAPVGPCRLISKAMLEDLNLWCIVGVEDDGTLYDPLAALIPPEHSSPSAAIV